VRLLRRHRESVGEGWLYTDKDQAQDKDQAEVALGGPNSYRAEDSVSDMWLVGLPTPSGTGHRRVEIKLNPNEPNPSRGTTTTGTWTNKWNNTKRRRRQPADPGPTGSQRTGGRRPDLFHQTGTMTCCFRS
jgi:hypothetical protein